MKVDVLICGAGPAGLAAAVELRRAGARRVLVVDREAAPGGVPRHCPHTGYGLRDLHRLLGGPAYARRYADAAAAAGAQVRAGTTVTGWTGDRTVTITSSQGIETVEAGAVLLATGCRERPRLARLVPGDRPPGVMTTGELQQRVYLRGQHRLAGVDRLAGVELADIRSGATRFVPCDTLVFTGDWIPDHELARLAGLAIDPGTRGPAVDTALQTSAPLVFAAGNLVHAAETADVAALGGLHAARHIAAALGGQLPPTAVVGVTVTPPLSWISPNAIRPATPPPRGRFVLRCCAFQRLARIEVRQDGRLLARSRPSALIPGRPVHLAGGWISQVDPAGGPVRVALAAASCTRGTMES